MSLSRIAKTHCKLCMLAFAAPMMTPAFAAAAVINANAGAFPTNPDVITVDALNVATVGSRTVSTGRTEEQSFTVSSDLTIGTIYLSATNYGNQPFDITFYQTDAVNGNPLTTGNQVGTIVVPAAGAAGTGLTNLMITLDPTEQVTLPALTGTAGYVMAIQLDAGASGPAFEWVHSNISGNDIYSGGRYRRDGGDQTNYRDFGLALVAGTAPIPEPASLSLLGIAGATLFLRRRRHA